jgi:2-succinyl-6-hydroxy-2,4-cyclohexadiene-1-carboxylate synthase
MLVLLHGFAGTCRAWDQVVEHLGGTPYMAPTIAAELPRLDERCTLVGYSMGGRIALQLALDDPEKVERLVLVSATAGLDVGREERRRADEELAARIEAGTMEQFADAWMAQPLFAGTTADVKQVWRADLLRNDPQELAVQLRTFGQGAMPPVWDRLGELTMPVAVVVGDRDEKYRAIGERLFEALPAGELHVIAGAGHGLPREAPRQLAAIVAPADPRSRSA